MVAEGFGGRGGVHFYGGGDGDEVVLGVWVGCKVVVV